MTLLHPYFLVPAALCLLAFLLWPARQIKDDWGRLMAPAVLSFLRPAVGNAGWNFALLALAIVLAALASPAQRADSTQSYALDEGMIVLADVSKSMGLDDIRPRRVAAARTAVLQLSAQAGARPSALIAYAGDAYLLQPFAVDRRQFDAFAAALDVGLVPQEGSNLERALALASSVIDQSGIGRARLIIVSDGGGFSGQIGFIAQRLAGKGHRVDIVLAAPPETALPSPIDIGAVQQTAEGGGGVLVRAGTEGQLDLAPLRLAGSLFEPSPTFELGLRSTEWRNLSHFLLLLAVPALLLAFRQVRR